jgi:hypothetical protein
MLWNWNTIDSCFLSSTWKITSNAVFAGSCIGVVLLVISLEMLRRAVKEYDRFLINKHIRSQSQSSVLSASTKETSREGSPARACATVVGGGYRPTLLEQAIRALLHMLQFAVAYFVMLYVFAHLFLAGDHANFAKTRHVLQWLYHHLHFHWCVHWKFLLSLGGAWRVSPLSVPLKVARIDPDSLTAPFRPVPRRRPQYAAAEDYSAF